MCFPVFWETRARSRANDRLAHLSRAKSNPFRHPPEYKGLLRRYFVEFGLSGRNSGFLRPYFEANAAKTRVLGYLASK